LSEHEGPIEAAYRDKGAAHMGEIIGAGLVAHAPTIMMPEADRYALN
jgi:hypothetical protein